MRILSQKYSFFIIFLEFVDESANRRTAPYTLPMTSIWVPMMIWGELECFQIFQIFVIFVIFARGGCTAESSKIIENHRKSSKIIENAGFWDQNPSEVVRITSKYPNIHLEYHQAPLGIQKST